MSHPRSLALAALCGFLSLTVRAYAQPAAPAATVESLLRHGVQLREQGDDLGAFGEFQRAYQLAPEPRVKAQIALAEQALGRWVDAAAHLREALGGTSDPWVQRNRTALEESLRVISQHLGRLRIDGGVAGAEVRIDDVAVGTLPLTAPIELRAGSAALSVRADGYYSLSRRVEIPAEGEAREQITLVSVPTNLPPPPPPPPVVVRPVNHTARTVGWITLSTAALVGAGSGLALYFREGVVSDYNGDAACPGASVLLQSQSCNARLDDGDNLRLWSYVGFGVAGALAVTSAVVFLAAPSSHPTPPPQAFGCAPTLGAPGLSCAATF